jgi:large subunit ribosomal protein L10
MVRPDKIAEVERLTEKLRASQGLVLADYHGLTVADASELRGKCREMGVEFRVVKNRLLKRAVANVEAEPLLDLLIGPTGVAFGMEGAVEPAKVLVEFAKDHEKLTIKGGFLDGEILTAAQVEALSKIPGRQELLAMIARGFAAPATNFVGVLASMLRNLVGVMDAVAKKKAETA